MAKKKKLVHVTIIIPDASPVLTLARLGRLDLLERFKAPVHIVDQVEYEITKPENDPTGTTAEFIKRHANTIRIVETTVGVGFKVRRKADPTVRSKDLGELAVEEYARHLVRTTGPSFVPLVLFEDPDVLGLTIANMKDVHLLNTTAFLRALYEEEELPEGKDLIDTINRSRKSPLREFEKPARTKRLRSQWLKRGDGGEE